jgi:hypothetical protein
VILVTVLTQVVQKLSESRTVLQEHGRLTQDARFAMDRMVRAVRGSRDLVLPQPDKPDTDWREHVREQTVPASQPEGSSAFASAVLAVSLSASVDLDADGFPDADNDRDGLLDEDPPADTNNDQAAGIYYIDDGGNGQTDEGNKNDDDEDGSNGEDPINGLDDDGDGLIDEDPKADTNDDGKPGFAGVDDGGDGQIDNGNKDDDDEDGVKDEDWLDTVVFYLQFDKLIERHPVPWDETMSGGITGQDFIESTIADDVSRFRVERIASSGKGEIVDITLDLTGPETGETISLNSRVRIGGAP